MVVYAYYKRRLIRTFIGWNRKNPGLLSQRFLHECHNWLLHKLFASGIGLNFEVFIWKVDVSIWVNKFWLRTLYNQLVQNIPTSTFILYWHGLSLDIPFCDCLFLFSKMYQTNWKKLNLFFYDFLWLFTLLSPYTRK